MADTKQCFVISPIGDADSEIRAEADWVLHHMIRPALEPEFKVTRADAFPKVYVITNEVINAIRKADLVVADMSGHNANVFYELAVAHAYHRPVIPLIREGQLPPFDNAPMGTIIYSRARYEKWEAAKVELKTAAEEAIKPGYTVSNPITMAIGQEQASQSGDTLAKLVTAQGEAIYRLEQRAMRQIMSDKPVREREMWLMHGRGAARMVRDQEAKLGRPLADAEIRSLLRDYVDYYYEYIRSEFRDDWRV